MSRRILILGNSGAGKTTLASRLAARTGLPVLDLDTVVWRRDEIGVRNTDAEVARALDAWVADHPAWIVEGSYGTCADHLAPHATELLFVNPGVARCLAHHAARPWEPHKYADPADQERNREMLAAWVSTYEDRPDEFGLAWHRRVFDAFARHKRELTAADLDALVAPAE